MRKPRFHPLRLWLVLLATAALVPALARAAYPVAWHYTVVPTDPPDPGSGWGQVEQLLTGSGCDGSSCGSSWEPENASYRVLLEKSSDRVHKAHGVGDGSPPYDATVVYDRERCPTDGAWAAGTWHHNFQATSYLVVSSDRTVIDDANEVTHRYITYSQRWRSGYYQSFAHADPCFDVDPIELATPIPTPGGGGPPSTPAPTTQPGEPTWTPQPAPTETPMLPTPTLPPNPCETSTNEHFPLWVPSGLSTTAPGPTRSMTDTTLLFTLRGSSNMGQDNGEWDVQQWKIYHGATGQERETKQPAGSEIARAWWETNRNMHLRGWWGSSEPAPRGFSNSELRAGVQTRITLNGPLAPGTYALYVKASNDHCESNLAWYYFQVGQIFPPPPPPATQLFGWVRSPHDGTAAPFVSTLDNPDPTHFAWMYAGLAEFYPDVALDLLPAYTAQGYWVERTITGWRFLGSPPLDAGTDDKRAYREPIRVLWSKYPPGELTPPDAYAYQLPMLREVTLMVEVAYTYRVLAPDGSVVIPPTPATIAGPFTISLVATQLAPGRLP